MPCLSKHDFEKLKINSFPKESVLFLLTNERGAKQDCLRQMM